MKLSIFLDPAQLPGQDNSVDHRLLKQDLHYPSATTSQFNSLGSSSAVRSFSCCVDQLTINFKLVIQGHSTPGSTAEYTYI